MQVILYQYPTNLHVRRLYHIPQLYKLISDASNVKTNYVEPIFTVRKLPRSRTVVFVLDTSNSMNGTRLAITTQVSNTNRPYASQSVFVCHPFTFSKLALHILNSIPAL